MGEHNRCRKTVKYLLCASQSGRSEAESEENIGMRSESRAINSAGGSPVPCGWEMECQGALQVLQVMSMVCPNQADSLQGSRGVNGDILAANDLGIGSGWQQSKQNRALPAVVGQQARMICNDLCWVQLAPLLPFLYS